MTPDPIEAVAWAIERIGGPLRVDAFNGIEAGKPDFAAMIVRDDEPGCASILAQQMADQMADDFIVVVDFARAAIAAMPKVEALAAENARMMKWLAFLADTIQQKGLGETAQIIRKKIAALTPEPDTIGYVDDTGGPR